MLRSEARELIVNNPARYLKLDLHSQRHQSGKPGYICPICGSGSGKNGTGITTKDGVHFTCWSQRNGRPCFTNADMLDIIGLEYGLTDYNAKLERACAEYGIDYSQLEADNGFSQTGYNVRLKPPEQTAQNKPDNTQETEKMNYVAFFKECARHRGESDYLIKRGISESVQDSFRIGFCPDWRSPAALKKGFHPPASPRIIIPTSQYSYATRDTRPEESMSDNERKYKKLKQGKVAFFNARVLETNQEPVFVVEGEIDALSIIELGYNALALGSTSNYEKFLDYVKENKPACPLLISLDADDSGQGTTPKLLAGLRELNIEFYSVDINGEYKDANDHLVADREGLKRALENALEVCKIAREDETQAYLRTSTAYYLKDFINGIKKGVDTPYTSTGFTELDKNLDGGLYEGLYIVGAISSLGKTTFVLQIADQIAKSGRDVLIFSLEMARNELIAKSISRLTAEIARAKGQPMANAKTTRGITVSKFYKSYSQEEQKLIDDALGVYWEYADRIFISEGIGDIGVNEIREIIKKHISITGNTPVVVLDYLQIIAPYNERATDKQNTDKAVLELKRMSRDYKIPIIGISSFNRENYNAGVSMQAFKESGAIEYSSDVLIGLQLSGTGTSGFDVNKAKKEEPRQIEAKILKNRNGKTGETIAFKYYPKFNYFEECTYEISFKPPTLPINQDKNQWEIERDELNAAFFSVQRDDLTAELADLAKVLGKTKLQVGTLITKYGDFVVTEDVVSLANSVESFLEQDEP